MKDKDGPLFTRRQIIQLGAAGGAGYFLATTFGARPTLFAQALPGPTLDPTLIPKFVTATLTPPAMPKALPNALGIDYEISVRAFKQQILPAGFGQTPVWSYCADHLPAPVPKGGTLHYPSLTIEAQVGVPTRVKWINGLVSAGGGFLPHLLPVDQNLHWANPPGGLAGRDMHGADPAPYAGPVPMSVHVHGAHTYEHSDGHPEAWFLPAAVDIPRGFATTGTYYDIFKTNAVNGALWGPGFAVFDYPNDQRATTLWYHDHALGMTRLNVYAGPAGFYLLRGGKDDIGGLPSGANELCFAIQDRSFDLKHKLFYPNNRAFFEGMDKKDLKVPLAPNLTIAGLVSDVPPIWNPEFFGNVMLVNGYAWPFFNVEARRYRIRLLNGCDSRFLILKFEDSRVKVTQIGAEQGFLAAPVDINAATNVAGSGLDGVILMGPAERADLIVDFSAAAGSSFRLLNFGPDTPFGGGPADPTGLAGFIPADPNTTGQVMEFRVGAVVADPVLNITLPAVPAPPTPDFTRPLSLNELMSMTVSAPFDVALDAFVLLAFDTLTKKLVIDPLTNTWVRYDPATAPATWTGRLIEINPADPVAVAKLPAGATAAPFGPVMAQLGTFDPLTGVATPIPWADPVITEQPGLGTSEVWEFYNFTADAHPMHIHLVQFQVVNRQAIDPATGALIGDPRPPEPWETGFKDTVVSYPGEVTRVQSTFDIAGTYVWHCHIVEHEDNEMMRPFKVV